MVNRKILIVLLLIPVLISGQYNYNPTFGQIGSDFNDLVISPKKWNNDDILKFTGLSLSTLFLMQFDGKIREFSLQNSKHRNSLIPELGRTYGEPYFNLLLGLAYYFIGSSQNNELNKKTGFEILESGLFSASTIGLIKYSFGRARPSTKGSDPYTYKPFSFKGNEYVSLASGHTALAFSTSTVISQNSRSGIIKGLIYIPAVVTGLSRIYQNHHWLSDVFLGAAIGYFIGKHVTELHDKKNVSERYNEIFKLSFKF